MIKNILLAGFLLGTALSANAQNLGPIEDLLDKIEKNQKSQKDYDEFSLTGKKFFLLNDAADHSEKHIVEFLADNKINLIEMIQDKKTQESFTNIFSGDVVRNHNNLSVRADKLEGKTIGMPLVYNFRLGSYKGTWYLKNINTNENWLETSYGNKK